MNELAKQLKDAGYPVNTPDVPDLSELIAACGEGFEILRKWDEVSYTAYSDDGGFGEHSMGAKYTGKGSTPEEAIAHLWLALNKPKS